MRLSWFCSLVCWCLLLSAASTAVRAAEISPQRLLLLRGMIALGEDQPGEALADLQDAASLMPEDWRSQMLYGQALVRTGHPAMARASLRRAVLLAPSRLEPWQALEQAAVDQHDVHLELEALEGQQHVLPDDPLLLHRLAEFYQKTGQTALASMTEKRWFEALPPLQLSGKYSYQGHQAGLEELRQLAQAHAGDVGILGALAAQEWDAQHVVAARALLKQLYDAQPLNLYAIANYVHVCLQTGQYEEGLRVLLAAIPLQYQEFERLPALWCEALGRYNEAILLLQQSLVHDPTNVALHRRLAVAYLCMGDYPQAESALQAAWQQGHTSQLALLYAALLHANGHDAAAESLLDGAIQQYPSETILKVELSRLYRDTNRMTHAADLTVQVAKDRPEAVELLILAGERYVRAGYVQRAYAVACTLRDDYPEDVTAVRGAMQLFRWTGNQGDAHLVMTRFLGPHMTPPIAPALLLLEVGNAAAEDNRLAEARIALESSLKADRNCRPSYEALGKLLMQQGLWVDAARIYAQALAQWPDDPAFMLELARADRQAGNYPQAIACYTHATLLMTSATPWLEWAAICHDLRQEAQARACWQRASTLPGGLVRGQLSLLASYAADGATERALKFADELLEKLAIARKATSKRWTEILAKQGVVVSDEELTALLQLDPEMTDPAPLQTRRDTLAAQLAATVATPEPVQAPEQTPTPPPAATTPPPAEPTPPAATTPPPAEPTPPVKPAPAKPDVPDFVNPPAEGDAKE